MTDYGTFADQIIEGVGGIQNISNVTHCFSRLRFTLKDQSLVDEAALKSLDGVAGTVIAAGQYQVVVGNEVASVFKEVSARVTGANSSEEPGSAGTKKGIGYWIGIPLNTMSATITPILPGLVVTGLFKAIVSILTLTGVVDTASQTGQLLNAIGDAFFYFMPFIVAWSASIHFQCNSVISMMLMGILMHPTFSGLVEEGGAIALFGLPVHAISYSASLLPALITVWVQSKIEHAIMSTPVAKLGQLLSQLPVFIIMAPLTLLVTGPVGSIIGEVIASAMLTLYNDFYVIGVFAVCALMPIFILTGSHWIFMPTALSNLETMGFDPFLWVGFAVINFSQLAVALAIFFKAKNRDIKSFAGSAALPIATAGITEPCMYGLTLKLKRPLVATFIGCAAGGIFCAFAHVKVYELVTVSLLSLPQFIDPTGSNNFVMAIIGMAITFAVTFAATWILGFDERDFEEE